ncbi:MAG: hypothetical protein HDT47_03445 [Ruminococcaceae bacterium]|nr:hypothetical protein [Oscillospiraceae bacterium]
MKIIIKGYDTNMNLTLPSRLILNGLTATLAPKWINKKINGFKKNSEISITGSQLRTLIREINRYRRKHKDWVLVEVEEGENGDRVIIKP